MESTNLSKTETAKFFDVSMTTVGNWERQGCPRNADKTLDPGAVEEWRILRDWRADGRSEDPLIRRFARALGELTRQQIRHNRRIAEVNALPADDIVEDSFGPRAAHKITLCVLTDLRGRILALPARVMARLPKEDPKPLAPIVLLCEEILKELSAHTEGTDEGENDD